MGRIAFGGRVSYRKKQPKFLKKMTKAVCLIKRFLDVLRKVSKKVCSSFVSGNFFSKSR
jgi:hypothetical protein